MFFYDFSVFSMFQIPPPHVDPCQDSILLYLSDVSTQSKFWPIIQYLETGRLPNGDPGMNRQAIVLLERDRQQFSLRLDQNFVHIIFKTDDETCTIDHIGNGFRVLAYASGKQFMTFDLRDFFSDLGSGVGGGRKKL